MYILLLCNKNIKIIVSQKKKENIWIGSNLFAYEILGHRLGNKAHI